MIFKDYRDVLISQFENLLARGELFVSSVTGKEVWDVYLSSFKEGDDPVFRDLKSSSHNCNTDYSFIKRYGNIVALGEDFKIITLFDLDIPEDSIYYSSHIAMRNKLKNAPIANYFRESYDNLVDMQFEQGLKKTQEKYRIGIESNHKIYNSLEAHPPGYNPVEEGKVYTFYHFYLDLPKEFVIFRGSLATKLSELRQGREVFYRGLCEIPLDTLILVRDLIQQGSLLNGTSYLGKLNEMINFKTNFDKLSEEVKENWSWVFGLNPFAKFRNELIGTLCVELAEGKELNKACKDWNIRVDPANYMKAVAPITEAQKKLAQKFVEENGYIESFDRRFATLEDINVEEIKHSNVGSGTVKTASIFDKVSTTKSTRHKRSQFDTVETVSIEKFMSDILPQCTSVEVFLENRFEKNLVALTTTASKESKPIFKWNNNFSWTYKGNLAGVSLIEENVKLAGGKVKGAFRSSLQWNDEDTKCIIDFDLHCIKDRRKRIYYSDKHAIPGGYLDVDMISPSKIGIENIIFTKTPDEGQYEILVNNFSEKANNNGFKVEIAIKEDRFTYFVPKAGTGETSIAKVTFTKDGDYTINHILEPIGSETTSQNIWGLDTQEFHKVNLVALSPNYWGENNIGHKHYLFMLDNCVPTEPLRGFHNENLNQDLLEHRKVMDVLGDTLRIEPKAGQLAGIGFNATIKNDLIVRLSGSFKRVVKIIF